MKKVVAIVCVGAAIAVALYVSNQPSRPSPPPVSAPQLQTLIDQCDAQGSSFALGFDKLSARMPELVGSDRATALAAARGQIANFVSGRVATCAQALVLAQHDRQGITVVKLGAFMQRLTATQAALKHLEDTLEGSGDAPGALGELTATVHAASRP